MICKEMASGFPLLTTIRTGKGFHSLKSNEIYVPPNEEQIVEGKSEGLHAIMLFGGGMGKGRLRFYRFVNTHSEDFCKLCTPRKDGLKGGFGNVIAEAILIQPVKFHRAGKGDHRPAELLEADKLTHAAPGDPRFIRECICWPAATSCQGYKFLAQETRTVGSSDVIDVGSLMQVRPKILSLYLRDPHGQTLGHFSVPELASCLVSGYFGTNLIIHVAYATPDALFLVLEDVTPGLWAKSPSEGFINAKSSRMPEVSHVRSAYLKMGSIYKTDSEGTRGPWQAYLCKLLKLYKSTYTISQDSGFIGDRTWELIAEFKRKYNGDEIVEVVCVGGTVSPMQPHLEIQFLSYRDPRGQIKELFPGYVISDLFEAGFIGIDLLFCIASAPPNAPFLLPGDATSHLQEKARAPRSLNILKQSDISKVSCLGSAYLELSDYGSLNNVDAVTEAENYFLGCHMPSNIQNPRAETIGGMNDWSSNTFGKNIACGCDFISGINSYAHMVDPSAWKLLGLNSDGASRQKHRTTTLQQPYQDGCNRLDYILCMTLGITA